MNNKNHIIQLQEDIKNAKHWIEKSDAILITAGAGMGVDSGLPDFRGNEGFWKAYPAMKNLGIGFQNMANPQWFSSNPKLAWAFYGHRFHLYKNTIPHKGFSILLNLVACKNNDYFIFTSNVDGQFQKAGFDERKIVEVHGNIHNLQCSRNCSQKTWTIDSTNIAIDMKKFEATKIPFCMDCDFVARPNILMFNDWNWNDNKTVNQERKYAKWLKTIQKSNKKLAIIEIGAGIAIPTVRNEGEKLATTLKNARLIRINPKEYEIDHTLGFSIPMGGLEGINEISRGQIW